MYEFQKRRLGCIANTLSFFDIAIRGDAMSLLRAYVGEEPPGLADHLLVKYPAVRDALDRYEAAVQRASWLETDVKNMAGQHLMPPHQLRFIQMEAARLPLVLYMSAACHFTAALQDAVSTGDIARE